MEEIPARASRVPLEGFAGTTVTFVFTDIESSTQLQARLRDRYAAAVADHRELVRRAVAERGGIEVDTQGDSFFFAFPRAIDALLSAVSAQKALAAHPWPEGEQLRVRMGLHSGEPTVAREGFVGLSVVRAARIMSAAHGGQILVSQATYSLVRDDLPPGIAARDLGTHRLKGLAAPERLYQISVEGLKVAFPRVRTATQRLHERPKLVMVGTLGAVTAVTLAALALSLPDGSVRVKANSLAEIDPAEGEVVATTAVGAVPVGLTHRNGVFWTANSADGTVTRIDSTGTPRTLPLGTPEDAHPRSIVATRTGVWIALGVERELRRIDARFGRLIGLPIPLSGVPEAIAEVGELICGATTATVECFDREGVRRVKVGPPHGATALASAGRQLWVGGASGITLLDVRNETLADVVALPGRVTAVAVGRDAVWVVFAAGAGVFEGRINGIARIDVATRSEVARVRLPARPSSIAYHDGEVWVTTMEDQTLHRIDARSLRQISRIELGSTPTAIAVAGGRIWVLTQ